MQSPRLKDPITAYELHEALQAVGAPPGAALRDPIVAMRFAASADLRALRRALAAVMVDPPEIEGEDEARLFAAAVMARGCEAPTRPYYG